MSESFGARTVLNWEGLLDAIPGDSPSGVLLRNKPEYDQLKTAFKFHKAGVASADEAATNYPALIALATKLLAKQSKDLDIAVWLTEALMRVYGLLGFKEGVSCIQKLLEAFWASLYPALDEGDEGYRAKPLHRLSTAFVSGFLRVPITFDGRKVYEFNESAAVPTLQEAERSEKIKAKREIALAEGVVSPEDFNRSILETTWAFYEELLDEIRMVKDTVAELDVTCNEKFTTRDRPAFTQLYTQIERLRLAVEEVRVGKSKLKHAESAVPLPPVPALTPTPTAIVGPAVPAPTKAAAGEPSAATNIQPVSTSVTPDIYGIAAAVRSRQAANPTSYLLVRAFRFGEFLEKGSVDANSLEPPPNDLRVSLRKASLANEWSALLERSEAAMSFPCSAYWLDLQRYSHRSCKELGYENAAAAVQALTALHVRSLPDLMQSVMLDGSPVASGDTLAWLRTDVLASPQEALSASLDEVRLEPAESWCEAEPADPFTVAENELSAGRFSEAFRVLSEAFASERSGRSKIQRKIQLAKICMEAGQTRLALPLLNEICAIFEERRLDTWETADFISAPLTMLYRCLEDGAENETDRRRLYDRICTLTPLKALELAGSLS